MRTAAKCQGAIVLSLALSACGAPPSRPHPPVPAAAPASGKIAPGQAVPGTRYQIDPGASELLVLVYRAGPMASLGHNHVVSTHSMQGWALFDGNAASASFALTFPVADFAVDDPTLRANEGSDFEEQVNDDARSGTLHNMLGPAVLNATAFPALKITSVSLSPAAGALRARVAIDIAGHESTIDVPFVLETSPHRLVGHGELTVAQSSLGLTPFSIFLGALKVQDELRVKFRFVAVSPGA
jgi:YceI-like domain